MPQPELRGAIVGVEHAGAVGTGGHHVGTGCTDDQTPGPDGEHHLDGRLTMPPLAEDPEESRPYFRRLRELAESLGLTALSMGTSQDYRVAAEEGATYVRVGSTVLGDRR